MEKQRIPTPPDERSSRSASAMPPSYNGNTTVLYSVDEGSIPSGGSKYILRMMKVIIRQRIFLTGDCHRDFDKIKHFNMQHPETSGSIMVLLGDTGINFLGDNRDEKKRAELSSLPYTFLMIHGNHEMRPGTIPAYERTLWEGNPCWVHPEHKNQIFLDDGEATIAGFKVLVAGGAYSVDKYYRLSKGMSWFEDEQMPEKTKDFIRELTAGKEYDIVFTHTCPFNDRPTDMFLPFIDQSSVDTSMEEFLQVIKDNLLGFGTWYCGHYHVDRKQGRVHFLYSDIVEHDENPHYFIDNKRGYSID